VAAERYSPRKPEGGECPTHQGKLEALNGQIPGLLKLEVGFDFSKSDMSADLVLYSEFESKEALQGYQDHPLHKAVQAFVKEARTERRVADYLC
jgi:heme-degrading monooxygenase HmoA